MAHKWMAVGLSGLLAVAAGCNKSDPLMERFGQQSYRAQPGKDPSEIPLADTPKILPQTHYAAGRLFETQGDVGKAIEQYRKAVVLNHNFAEGYHRLGRLLNVSNQHDEALKAFARAVELAPNNAGYRNDLGFEFMYAAHWSEAERELRKAIEIEPGFARAHVNLALTLSRTERFDEALAVFRAVLPEEDAHYNLGLMYRGQQRYSEAAASFRRVLEINPDFPAAQVQLDQLAARVEAEQTQPTMRLAESTPTPALETPTVVAPLLVTPTAVTRSLAPTLITEQPTTARTVVNESAEEPASVEVVPALRNSPAPSESAAAREVEVLGMVLEEFAPDETAPDADPVPASGPQEKREAVLQDALAPGRDQAFAPPTSWTEWDGERVTVKTLYEILNNESNCLHDQVVAGPIESPANGSIADAAGVGGTLDPNTVKEPCEAALPMSIGRPLRGVPSEMDWAAGPIELAPAHEIQTLGPAADPRDTLILRDVARRMQTHTVAANADWRTPFADLMSLAFVTRNDHLCWREVEELQAAQLATTTRVVPARSLIQRPEDIERKRFFEPVTRPKDQQGPPALGSPVWEERPGDDPLQE